MGKKRNLFGGGGEQIGVSWGRIISPLPSCVVSVGEGRAWKREKRCTWLLLLPVPFPSSIPISLAVWWATDEPRARTRVLPNKNHVLRPIDRWTTIKRRREGQVIYFRSNRYFCEVLFSFVSWDDESALNRLKLQRFYCWAVISISFPIARAIVYKEMRLADFDIWQNKPDRKVRGQDIHFHTHFVSRLADIDGMPSIRVKEG